MLWRAWGFAWLGTGLNMAKGWAFCLGPELLVDGPGLGSEAGSSALAFRGAAEHDGWCSGSCSGRKTVLQYKHLGSPARQYSVMAVLKALISASVVGSTPSGITPSWTGETVVSL